MRGYFSMETRVSSNLGDDIQSLAAEQFLPRIDGFLDRDTLRFSHALVGQFEKVYVVVNGWYSHTPELCFPFHEKIVPCFLGFHLNRATQEYIISCSECIDFLVVNSPIGARDTATYNFLKKIGAETFYQMCLTLCFPKRKSEPQESYIFLVDVDDYEIPWSILSNSIRLTHHASYYLGLDIKRKMAKSILSLYYNLAKVVITSRLHCALPCLAMGIPVIFLGNPNDPRFSPLIDLGLRIYQKLNNIDSQATSLSMLGSIKEKIISETCNMLKSKFENESIHFKPIQLEVENPNMLLQELITFYEYSFNPRLSYLLRPCDS